MYIRGNTLNRVVTEAVIVMPMLDRFLEPTVIEAPQPAYKTLKITENTIEGFPNSCLAETVIMSHNNFAGFTDQIRMRSLGYSGVFIGNVSQSRPIHFLKRGVRAIRVELPGTKTYEQGIDILGDPNHQVLNVMLEKM